jgi:hypothetical protein
MKISSFIIGIIICSIIVGVVGLFMAEMGTNYSVDYDNTSLEAYQNMEAMTNLSREIEQNSNIEEKTGVLDIIGSYFTDAYNVLRITKKSYNTFDTMSNQAVEDAQLGAAGSYFKVGIGAIILIAIVLGVIISAIVKKDI